MPQAGCNLFDGTKAIGPIDVLEDCGPQSREFLIGKAGKSPAVQPGTRWSLSGVGHLKPSSMASQPRASLTQMCASKVGVGGILQGGCTCEGERGCGPGEKSVEGALNNSGTSELTRPVQAQCESAWCTATCLVVPILHTQTWCHIGSHGSF